MFVKRKALALVVVMLAVLVRSARDRLMDSGWNLFFGVKLWPLKSTIIDISPSSLLSSCTHVAR